jgi:exopolyphosphatase/guanosine-5'-triphosphate,3'-diphosphate pyrophosphatase
MALLDADERERVRKLAAILRVADGLDRSRRGVLEDVRVNLGTDLVVLRVTANEDAELELWGARRRRELFEKVFQRELEITASTVRSFTDV